MENIKPQEEFCIEVFVEGNFEHFVDFMDYSREHIYGVITEGFKQLVEMDAEANGKIVVEATVQGKRFDSKFSIGIKTLNYLTEAILPYYIVKEEYEKCAEVQSILKQFANAAQEAEKFSNKIKN